MVIQDEFRKQFNVLEKFLSLSTLELFELRERKLWRLHKGNIILSETLIQDLQRELK